MTEIINRIKKGLKAALVCAVIPLLLSACWEDLEEISDKVSAGFSKVTRFAVFKTGAGDISGYTLVAGEDGHPDMRWGKAWPAPRFTDNGNGTITDNMTGLMWTQNANMGGPMIWNDATTYIANTVNQTDKPGGHGDWRMPNYLELLSMINYGVTSVTWLTNQGFTNVQGAGADDVYWSSSTHPIFSGASPLYVHFGRHTADRGYDKTSELKFVWPVRGSSNLRRTGQTTEYTSGDDGTLQEGIAWPSPRFTDNGDNTITDNLSGLMWTKNADLTGSGTNTWSATINYITTTLNQVDKPGGYSDWRLPSVTEFRTLVNAGQLNASTWLEGVGFTNVQESPQLYWSSTTFVNMTGSAHIFTANTGSIGWDGKTTNTNRHIWAVRGGTQ